LVCINRPNTSDDLWFDFLKHKLVILDGNQLNETQSDDFFNGSFGTALRATVEDIIITCYIPSFFYLRQVELYILFHEVVIVIPVDVDKVEVAILKPRDSQNQDREARPG